MKDEDEVTEYYSRFLDLIKPLLDGRWLDKVEQDMLFWYGFHSEDRATLLCRLSGNPHHPSRCTFLSERYSLPPATSSLKIGGIYSENATMAWCGTRDLEGHTMTTGAIPSAGLHSRDTGHERLCENLKTKSGVARS